MGNEEWGRGESYSNGWTERGRYVGWNKIGSFVLGCYHHLSLLCELRGLQPSSGVGHQNLGYDLLLDTTYKKLLEELTSHLFYAYCQSLQRSNIVFHCACLTQLGQHP
jgi:hypothetical protein